MKTIIPAFCCIATLGAVAIASAADKQMTKQSGKTCGQMTAERAVMPSKMAEVMTAVADMYDAHANFMATVPEAKAEMEGMRKLAQEHRDMAAMATKTAQRMRDAASWPAAMHDETKLMADPKIQDAMKRMISSQREMIALMQKEVSAMESASTKPKAN